MLYYPPFPIISRFYYSPLLLFQLSIVLSHTIASIGLLTLLSCLLLSRLLLSCLLIVLAYYTALNWHSIHSSTFLYNDSLSRVSCLSWQSMCSLGAFQRALLRRLFLSWRQIPIFSYNCHRDGSPLISIAVGLADRSFLSLHINTVMRTVIRVHIRLGQTRASFDPSIIDHCRGGTITTES